MIIIRYMTSSLRYQTLLRIRLDGLPVIPILPSKRSLVQRQLIVVAPDQLHSDGKARRFGPFWGREHATRYGNRRMTGEVERLGVEVLQAK